MAIQGKELLGCAVISSAIDLIAQQRITPCPEMQHRVLINF
jgi:hypothetical protein